MANENAKYTERDYAPTDFDDAELEKMWLQLHNMILVNYEPEDRTVSDWFIFKGETPVADIYEWFGYEHSEGLEYLLTIIDDVYKGCDGVSFDERYAQPVEFICATRFPEVEWIGRFYNVAYKGTRRDDEGLRNYVLRNFAKLSTEKLLTLFLGESYTEVSKQVY